MSVKVNSNNVYISGGVQKTKYSADGAATAKKGTQTIAAAETDTAEISDWAKALQKMKDEKESIKIMAENATKQSEATDEGYDDFGKAMEIFRRISHGDHVPPKDEKFLMEYSSDMYLKAKTMQINNKDPKDYESILDEDDDDNYAEEAAYIADQTISETAMPEASGEADVVL